MRNLIAVIGTSHTYQFGGSQRSDDQNSAFREFIEQTCSSYKIRCLAEEMSHDALRLRERAQSTVELIAADLGLSHLYCDPSESEQSAMGLRIERDAETLRVLFDWSEERLAEGINAEHRKREQFWFDKLKKHAQWPCLFICGSNHVTHFCSLLKAYGFQVKLIASDWAA